MTNTTSPTTDPPTADQEAANAGIVRRFVTDVINEGRSETIADVLHTGYRYHGPDGEVADGPDAAWQIINSFRSAFSDLHAEITSETAQDDRVALTLVMTGTHDGDFMGIAATGASIELPIAVISRLGDERIIEEWEYYDSTALVSQIAATPSTGETAHDAATSGTWSLEAQSNDNA